MSEKYRIRFLEDLEDEFLQEFVVDHIRENIEEFKKSVDCLVETDLFTFFFEREGNLFLIPFARWNREMHYIMVE